MKKIYYHSQNNSINRFLKNKYIIIFFTNIIFLLIILLFGKNSFLNELNLYSKNPEIIDKTDAEYKLTQKVNEDTYKVNINLNNKNGIIRIICPNENEISTFNKQKVSIDYEIRKEKNYEFKIITNNGEEVLKLYGDKINTIQITQNDSYLYPLLTEYEIDTGKNFEITYAQEENNYYSLDNGITWIPYEGKVHYNKEGKVLAKSKNDGEIIQIVSANITMQFAGDAASLLWYDGDTETGTNSGKLKISEETWGKNIIITEKYYTDYSFRDKDGKYISGACIPGGTNVLKIPNNAVYFIATGRNGYRIVELNIKK